MFKLKGVSRLLTIFSKQKLTYSNILKAVVYLWAATLCFPVLQGTFYAVFVVMILGVIKGELNFKSFKNKEECGKETFSTRKLKGQLPFLSLSLYIIYLTSSIFWSKDFTEFFRQFEKLVPLYLLTIILNIDGIENHLKINKILDAFLCGVVTSLGYMVVMMGINCFIGSTIGTIKVIGVLGLRLFDYIQHYTYLGTTLLMAIPLLLLKAKQIRGFQKISCLFLVSFICFLCISSYGRIVMLLTIIVLIFSFFSIWGKEINKIWKITSLACFLLIGSLLILNSPRIISNLSLLNSNEYEIGSIDPRIDLWNTAIRLIKQKPLFGYGISDQHDIFIKENANLGHLFFADQGYNAHNQYFQTLLSGGLVGLFLLLIFLISVLKINESIKITYLQQIRSVFVIIYSVVFMVESILVRNIGVLPLIFWIFILTYNYKIDYPVLNQNYFPYRFSNFIILLFISIFIVAKIIPLNSKNPRTYMTGKFEVVKWENLPDNESLPYKTNAVIINSYNVQKYGSEGYYMFSRLINKKFTSLIDINASIWCYVDNPQVFEDVFISLKNENAEEKYQYNMGAPATWQKLNVSMKEIQNLTMLITMVVLDRQTKIDSSAVYFAYPTIN